jgi:hypothetical protein
MDHKVAKIQEHPAPAFHPFYGARPHAEFFFEPYRDAFRNGANLASIAAATD